MLGFAYVQLGIVASLLTVSAGLVTRRLGGFWLAVAGIFGVVACVAAWYVYAAGGAAREAVEADLQAGVQSSLLYGASGLHWFTLFVVAVLAAWALLVASRLVTARPAN